MAEASILPSILSTASLMVTGVVCMLAVDGRLRREGQVSRSIRQAGLAVAAGCFVYPIGYVFTSLLPTGVDLHDFLLPLALALGPWQPDPRASTTDPPVPTGLVAGGLGVVAATLDLTAVWFSGHMFWQFVSQLPTGLASLGLSVWLLRQCRPWVTPTERKVSLVALGTWAVMLAALLLHQES